MSRAKDLQLLEQAADDILRCVVCDCGNYRHHGVRWMPDESGEGLPRVLELLGGLASGQPPATPRRVKVPDRSAWKTDSKAVAKALGAEVVGPADKGLAPTPPSASRFMACSKCHGRLNGVHIWPYCPWCGVYFATRRNPYEWEKG